MNTKAVKHRTSGLSTKTRRPGATRRRLPPRAGPQFVTALARGLEIMRCFTPQRPELGTTEIARLTGMPQPTVWRLCYTLQHMGCLVPGRAQEKLRPGPAMLALGYAAVSSSGLAEFAYPLMRDLADRYHVAVTLAMRERLNMVVVQRAEAFGVPRLGVYVGSVFRIATGTLGRAYLAGVDDATRDDLFDALRRESPDDWDATRKAILAALRERERTGFVLNLREFHPRINSIGMPIVSPDGHVIAVTCGGDVSIVSRKLLEGRSRARCARLAQRIGPVLATL